MSDKFDKFTKGARDVLTRAQKESQLHNHDYIGTEHLLLGLVNEPNSTASRALANLGLTLPKVRSAVESTLDFGKEPVTGDISLNPRARNVIEISVDEARRLGHHYIGTEHLLLAILRENEGIAAGVLKSLGVSLQDVREQVLHLLSPNKAKGNRS